MYSRPVTEIHQIEITTRCNLACRYCPHPKMKREKTDMTDDIFDRSLDHAEYYYRRGTQKELSITGIGESTLHPNLIPFLERARQRLPNLNILFSTNGLPSFTEEIAIACQKFSIGVYISLHRPDVAGRTVDLCKKYGIIRGVNSAAATNPFDWAGQVDWHVSAPSSICAYLQRGWAAVLQDGDVTTCCLDAEKKGIIGHVRDATGNFFVRPYSLCNACHEKVPAVNQLMFD